MEDRITLFQLHKTDEMVEFVNGPDGGWTNAAEKYPAWQAHLDTSFNGSKEWKPEYFGHYRAVARINTNEIEESFSIANAYGGSHMDMVERGLIEPLLPLREIRGHRTPDMHSMSVGDIVSKGLEYWMCDPMGFTKITVDSEEE